MTSGNHGNNPAKGSTIKVEPIKSLKDIKTIKTLLKDNPIHYALFVTGINTNLRASDLLRLTAGQVRGLMPGDSIEVKEVKTGKLRRITLNKAVIDALRCLLASAAYEDEDRLFKSHKARKSRDGGKVRCLGVSTVNRLVKKWCKQVNLKGNFGSHTLRKTFGYHQHHTFGVSLPILMEAFNHSSQRMTLDYICIQSETLVDMYSNQL